MRERFRSLDSLENLYAANYVKEAYTLLKAEDKLDRDIFEGRHQISGRKSYDWLKRCL